MTGWPGTSSRPRREGAEVVVDGRDVKVPGYDDGFFLGPCLVDRVTPSMQVYRDEIFGPVLSVLRVDDLDQAIDVVNANPYGNGTAIFTRDGSAARRFRRDVHGGDGRHQRGHPGAHGLLLVRRMEAVALR